MTKIEQLKADLKNNEEFNAAINSELQVEYNKVFNDSTVLDKAVKAANESKEYRFNEYGEIESWSRCYDLKGFEDCMQYLAEWFYDQGMRIDWENECILVGQGGCFVINDSGDVYDTDNGKFFLSKSDYLDENGDADETVRNRLIEEHMTKTGYFPGVFSADRHGNVFLVNTKG